MAKVTMVFEDHNDGDGMTVMVETDPEMPGLGAEHTPAQTALLLANLAISQWATGTGANVERISLDDLEALPGTDGEHDDGR